MTFAYKLKKRLVRMMGSSYLHKGQSYYRFPTSERIANCSPNQLTDLQFSARKAEYVIGIARAMWAGDLSREMLLALGEDDARETLIRYKGVGAWTANYVMFKCLALPDAFPAQDVGLHNAIKQLLGLPAKPDLSTVRRYAEAWRGWRGYATFYLWQTLLPAANATD